MTYRRPFKSAHWLVAFPVVVVLLLLTWRSNNLQPQRDPEIKDEAVETVPVVPIPLNDIVAAETEEPPKPDPAELCAQHGWQPYEEPRKVYDLFLMANELDFLEIRLNTLDRVVDYFVIVTAGSTFTGIPQPSYLSDNWDRYEKFHHKIIHHVVNEVFEGPWQHEKFMRDALLTAVHLGPVQPEKGDVILVSDLDEIPRPEIVDMLRQCDYPERLTLHTRFYYYAYQWMHSKMQWWHPQATVYNGEDTINPDSLRMGSGNSGADIWDAGWHCSSCFKTIKQVLAKLEGFSHAPEWNTPQNRDPATIVHRFQNGLDLYGRPEEVYDNTPTDDVPSYVGEHRDRFRYLLDRTSQYAEFEDGPAYLDGLENA